MCTTANRRCYWTSSGLRGRPRPVVSGWPGNSETQVAAGGAHQIEPPLDLLRRPALDEPSSRYGKIWTPGHLREAQG